MGLQGGWVAPLYTPGAYLANLPQGGIKTEGNGDATGMRHENKPKLLGRLNRVEGQVRGISKMIADGRYCIDILTQLQAVRAALVRVETDMLKDHLSHCVEDAIVSGDTKEQRKKVGELIELLGRSTR